MAQTIRQEINILCSSYSGTGTVSSNEIVNLDTTKYSGTCTFYFEAVYSGAASNTGTIKLTRSGTTTNDASINGATSATLTLTRSSSFTPPAGATQYIVRLVGDGTRSQTVKAARIVIIQTQDPFITNTRTIIEIGNSESSTNSTLSALTNPKYWRFNTSNWYGSNLYRYQGFEDGIRPPDWNIDSGDSTWNFTPALNGSFSLQCPNGRGASLTTGASDQNEVYVFFRFRTPATLANKSILFWIINPTAGGFPLNAMADVKVNTNGTVQIGCKGSDNAGAPTATTVGTVSTSTTYYAWLHFKFVTATTSVLEFEFQTTPVRQGSGNNYTSISNGTSPNGCHYLECHSGSSPNDAYIYDDVFWSTTDEFAFGAAIPSKKPTIALSWEVCWKIASSKATATAQIQNTDGTGDNFAGWANIGSSVTSTSSTATLTTGGTLNSYDGAEHRLVASTSSSKTAINIYRAAIIIDSGDGTNPIPGIEGQYLLANTLLASGTSAQNFLTKWDSTDWANTQVSFQHQADSANGSTSVVELDVSGGAQVTGSVVTSPDNQGTSSTLTMPASNTLDCKATTNNNDLYASRIICIADLHSTQKALELNQSVKRAAFW